jgi:hypothetical protein
MKTFLKFPIFFIVTFLTVISCNPDEPIQPTEELIDPSNANALTQVLIMPSGTQTIPGQPPAPSGQGAPTVSSQLTNVLGSNGSSAPLTYDYSNVSNNLGGCYVQVVGANRYFNIPYGSSSGSSGTLSLPIVIPTNVDAGQFCVDFCVYNLNGRVSNIIRTCVTVIRLGTGALQISLTWSNDSDQDLYVTTPSGCVISYQNDSCGNGNLDRDDTNGYGPENVFWESSAPDGQYIVKVNDFDFVSSGTDFFININAPGVSRQFPGRTLNGNTVTVVTFTKNGSSFIF